MLSKNLTFLTVGGDERLTISDQIVLQVQMCLHVIDFIILEKIVEEETQSLSPL